MRTGRGAEQRVFFRWERRGSLLRRLGLYRARPFFFVAVVIALAAMVGVRERRRAGVRQTRATLLALRDALDSYLADHGGDCPRELAALSDYGSFKTIPKDAWGRPFRLTCPGRSEAARYELASDGPDGRAGGLDRIE